MEQYSISNRELKAIPIPQAKTEADLGISNRELKAFTGAPVAVPAELKHLK